MVPTPYFQGEIVGISGILKRETQEVSDIPAFLQIFKSGRKVAEEQMSVIDGVYGYELDTMTMEGVYALRVVLKPENGPSIVVSRNPVQIEIFK